MPKFLIWKFAFTGWLLLFYCVIVLYLVLIDRYFTKAGLSKEIGKCLRIIDKELIYLDIELIKKRLVKKTRLELLRILIWAKERVRDNSPVFKLLAERYGTEFDYIVDHY
jgi:hypothetical protein